MKVTRHNAIAAFFTIQFILIVISLIFLYESNGFWTAVLMLLSWAIMVFIYYGISPLLKKLNDAYIVKRECPYLTAQECPYWEPKQCKYDKSACHYDKEEDTHKFKGFIIGVIAFMTLTLTVLGGLIDNNQANLMNLFRDMNHITWIRILAPLSTSVLAAIIMAWILDIPSRMIEYKNYFIRILSSPDYLKLMKEEDLSQLRSTITRLLHAKDVPNMPKRLIQMDEQICQLLKQPYYNEYMQTVKVSKSQKDGFFHKTINIEFIAINPYKGNRPIVMDIGMANSLKFSFSKEMEDEAKELFKLKRFSVSFDNDKEERSLMPKMKIAVIKDNEPGLIYNGKIVPVFKETKYDAENPLKIEELVSENKKTNLDYEKSSTKDYSLYVQIKDKIKVNIEYDVTVPAKDNTYTKRLRYPVKIFHLDYTLDDTIDEYTLVGQLIGTLIDQNNVSTELSEDEKRICLRTHEFLLPKNGAVIVHCSGKK